MNFSQGLVRFNLNKRENTDMNHSVAIGNILVHLERSAAAPCWVKGRKCQDLDVVVRLRAKVCGCKRCQELSASGARTQKCKIDFVDYIIQYHFYCWGIFILFDWLGHIRKTHTEKKMWWILHGAVRQCFVYTIKRFLSLLALSDSHHHCFPWISAGH